MEILIIEDEKELRESIVSYLIDVDYVCEVASNYKEALKKIALYAYDCIVLDISIPGGHGLNLLREMKANHKMVGVLIISAKDFLDDGVTDLTLGADHYLGKPFYLSELSARIAAIIRQRNFQANDLLKFKNISIYASAKLVCVNDNSPDLTRKEYELLLYFVSHRKKVILKTAISKHLWGGDLGGSNDFIYTHIKNLRKKLSDAGDADFIISVYGIEYKFSD